MGNLFMIKKHNAEYENIYSKIISCIKHNLEYKRSAKSTLLSGTFNIFTIWYNSPVVRSRKGLYLRSQVNPRARKFLLVSCFRPTLGAYRQGGCRLLLWGYVLNIPIYVKRPQNGKNNRYKGRKTLKHL